MYSELLLFIDSCEAESMFDQIETPNILMMSSSRRDENAFSHAFQENLNTFLGDKFTFYLHLFLKESSYQKLHKTTLKDFPQLYDFSKLDSHLAFKNNFPDKNLEDFKLTDYFPASKEDVIGNRKSVVYMDYADLEENLL